MQTETVALLPVLRRLEIHIGDQGPVNPLAGEYEHYLLALLHIRNYILTYGSRIPLILDSDRGSLLHDRKYKSLPVKSFVEDIVAHKPLHNISTLDYGT